MKRKWWQRILDFFIVLPAEIEYAVTMWFFKRRHPTFVEWIAIRRREIEEAQNSSYNNARDEICPHCSGQGYQYWGLDPRKHFCDNCEGTGKLSPIA